eukprot:1160722-Pelagomonas_calceolata.AAC.17
MTCLMPNNLLQPYSTRARIDMIDLEGVLRAQIIHAWRSLDELALRRSCLQYNHKDFPLVTLV